MAANGYVSLFVALARDPDGASFFIQVMQIEAFQLRQPQAGALEHLEDGAVAKEQRFCPCI